MKKQNSLRIKILMISTVILLLLLQAWWLQTEYKTAVDAFERETDLVFKSTVKQIADSALFAQLSKFNLDRKGDSTAQRIARIFLEKDSIFKAKEIKIEKLSIKSEFGPDSINLDLNLPKIKQLKMDSLPFGKSKRDEKNEEGFNLFFHFGIEEVDEDSLKIAYYKSLSKELASLNIVINSKKAKENEFNLEQDSLAFTTSYYRLGKDNLYAASFENAFFYIIKRISPQIGFSIFLSSLLILSFIFIYKSLKAQAQLLNQKDDFIANMTHELKTPIATVSVALEAIQNFNVLSDPDKAKEYLNIANKELLRLEQLTDKVLHTSIFDYQQSIQLEKRELLLKDCLVEMSKNMESALFQAGMKLEMNIQTDGKILGHASHLCEMLHNIIENAIKYAPNSQQIEVRLSEKEHQIILEIMDQGPGIAEEHLHKVFEKFYRVPSHDVHNVKGYGLGLSYVVGVVHSHQGEIKLFNRSAGGLAVKIVFPKAG